MLVLSRKLNEAIVIGGKIVVKVVEIRGDRVRLGIEAPPATPIHRSEVYDAIRAATRQESDLVATGPLANGPLVTDSLSDPLSDSPHVDHAASPPPVS